MKIPQLEMRNGDSSPICAFYFFEIVESKGHASLKIYEIIDEITKKKGSRSSLFCNLLSEEVIWYFPGCKY